MLFAGAAEITNSKEAELEHRHESRIQQANTTMKKEVSRETNGLEVIVCKADGRGTKAVVNELRLKQMLIQAGTRIASFRVRFKIGGVSSISWSTGRFDSRRHR